MKKVATIFQQGRTAFAMLAQFLSRAARPGAILVQESPEIAGILCGLFMLTRQIQVNEYREAPYTVLRIFTVLAVAAGGLTGAAAAWTGTRPDLAARAGARAACWAGLAAALCLLLLTARLAGTEAARSAALVSAGCVLPAAFAGSIAATSAAVILRGFDAGHKPRKLPKTVTWGLGTLLAAGAAAALTGLVPGELKAAAAFPQSFSFSTPPSLATAHPAQWEISAVRSLGGLSREGAVFSRSQRFLAGTAGEQVIVVHDLEKGSARRFSYLPYPLRFLCFSPDSKKLFVVMNGDPRRLAVAFVETGEIIALPQPRKYAVPEDPILWRDEEKILFFSRKGQSRTYDLRSLELDPVELTTEEKQAMEKESRPDFPGNTVWRFRPARMAISAELPETEGVPQWPVAHRMVLGLEDCVRLHMRLLPAIDYGAGDTFLGTSDGSKILRFRNGGLEVFYFGLRSAPSLTWALQLPHAPEKMPQSREVLQALESGSLRFHLYAPLINPLTRETVGPDRSRLKSTLGVIRWEGSSAEAWIETLGEPWAPGDVFADLFVAGESPQILAFDQPHRWWTAAPNPAEKTGEENLIPTRAELSEKMKAVAAKEEAARRKPPTESGGTTEAPTAGIPEENPVPSERGPMPDHPPSDPAAPKPDVLEEIREFVLLHHAKLSEEKVDEAVSDYADRVDHFDHGVVGRDYILTDEKEYHRKHDYVRETVRKSDIVIRQTGPRIFQIQYPMRSESSAGGKINGGVYKVLLVIERRNSGGWQIIRHKSPKS